MPALDTAWSDVIGTIDLRYSWIEIPMGMRRHGMVWRRGAWRMVIGSPAWSDFYGYPEEPGWEVNRDTGTPWEVPKTSGDRVDAIAGPVSSSGVTDAMEDVMPTEYTNDPELGVVPVGQVTDQGTAARVWTLPARLVAKVLPAGPVPAWQGQAMEWLPWAVWAVLAWWAWNRSKR